MSTTVSERPAEGRLRRHRSTLLVVLGLVVAVAVVVLVGADERRYESLDPANADPDGARAVARVLEDEGVDVTVVRSADELDDTDLGPDATVVVTSTDQLGRSTARRLVEHAADARVVVVEPGPGTADALGVAGSSSAVAPDDPVAADCADPAYSDLSLAVDQGRAYRVDAGCFGTPEGALLAEPRPGITLLGAGDVLSNDEILRADNAALALRLLGATDRLVWYVPSLDDLGAADGVSAASLLPRWLRPALLLTLAAVVALILWRARRLGALATEPLPVTVKAIETTRSRGRLYRRAGDRAHAAAVLREAARARMADRLRMGSRPHPAALVQDVARHTGRPVAEIDVLLAPGAPPPATDHDLITLAARLAELDREVRRP